MVANNMSASVSTGLSIGQWFVKNDCFFHAIPGLWNASDILAGARYVLISKSNDKFELTMGFKMDGMTRDHGIPQHFVDQLGLALMKTNKFTDDLSFISFHLKSAGEVKDILSELIRNHRTENLTVLKYNPVVIEPVPDRWATNAQV
jgi:hypothetical protein